MEEEIKTKICKECGVEKPVEEFGSEHRNGKVIYRGKCKVCEWKRRHKNLQIKGGWTEKEYDIIIDNLLNKKVECVNDIIDLLNDKKLNELIDLLHRDLKIANVPIMVKINCNNCKKEFFKKLSVYLKSDNHFCSDECYYSFKKENTPIGEDSKFYNRITTQCAYCNKKIEVIPFDLKRNKHNFCSQECYWKFRSIYYIGEKCNTFGVKFSKERRQKMRETAIQLYKNGNFNRQTLPQKTINEVLENMGVEFVNEYDCKYYSIDNYLPKYNLMVEINGDYYHAHPQINDVINDMQYDDIVRDKRKHTYIKRYKDIEILYLWENDVNNNLDLCKKLIEIYINNHGILQDYNSFNYILNDRKEIYLKQNLIKPYMQYTSKELNKILLHDDNYKSYKQQLKEQRYKEFRDVCICANCGKEVLKLKSRLKTRKTDIIFCDKNCQNEYYDKTKIVLKCDFCGKEIIKFKKDVNKNGHNFCDEECFEKYTQKDKISTICDNCGKEITMNKERCKNQEHHFCNKECYNEFRKKVKS